MTPVRGTARNAASGEGSSIQASLPEIDRETSADTRKPDAVFESRRKEIAHVGGLPTGDTCQRLSNGKSVSDVLTATNGHVAVAVAVQVNDHDHDYDVEVPLSDWH